MKVLQHIRIVGTIMAVFFTAGLQVVTADVWTDVQQILDDVKPVIDGPMPVVTTPETQTSTPWEANYGRQAMHLGNGDMGVACGSTDAYIEYHPTFNEFQGLIGRLFIERQSGSGNSSSMTARHEMNMKNGEVLITGKVDNTKLDTRAYVPYEEGRGHKNYLIVEVTNNDGANAPIRIAIEPDRSRLSSGNALSTAGREGSNLIWGKRQTTWDTEGETVYWRAAFAAKILGATPSTSGNSSTESWLDITLAPNQTIEVVFAIVHESGLVNVTGSNTGTISMPTLDAIFQEAKLNLQSVSNTATLRADHLAWWKAYWLKAHADFNDQTLHEYYYGALYNMGVSTRPYCAPTGLYGLFKHTAGYAFNSTVFSPDMHFLNYNFQAGFYGYGSSDRTEQLKAYPEAVFAKYADWRAGTAFDAGFRGVQFFDRWSNQGVGGDYGDPDSAKYWADKRAWGWDKYIGKGPGVGRKYNKLNLQKSLGALFAVNLVKGYLYSEDMDLMDYTSDANFPTLDQNNRGLSVYQLLLLITEFYEDYIMTECKDALNPDGSFALNPDGSRREWQASDGDNYVYRIYDSWAREPEGLTFPSNVRPRLGTGDQDTVYDLGPIRYLLRGMIKISSDRGDTAKHAIWNDLLDHLVDYPTTANSPSDPEYIGRPVYKECYNRPEINYNSQGRHTYIGTMMTWVHPADECRPGSPEAAMARDTIHELGLWKAHENYNVVADPSSAVWNQDGSEIIGCTRNANNTLSTLTENDYLEVMKPLFDDWNNFANLYPLLVRCFYDGERIIEFLHYERTHYGFHEQNLLVDNGPESNSIVEALNDMLIMSHLSPNGGNGSLDKADERYIKLFPVWPKSRDARFHEIAARGAFLVSAEQKTGEVISCTIKSRHGNICRLDNPWPGDGVQVFEVGSNAVVPTRQTGEIYAFNTTAGKTYRIEKGTPVSGIFAKLAATPTKGSIPFDVTYTLSGSVGNISSYQLDVDGDGSVDYTGVGPHTHTFATAGKYVSTLTIAGGGLTDSVSKKITAVDGGAVVAWPAGKGTGVVTLDKWNNVPGSDPSGLTPFLNTTPDSTDLGQPKMAVPDNYSNNATGHRLSGVVTIPLTANYTFYVAANPSAELWIGADGTTNNLTLLVTGSNTGKESYSSGSSPIALSENDQVYLEVRHVQNGPYGHTAVGWKTDTLPVTTIASEYISPLGTPPPGGGGGSGGNALPVATIFTDKTAVYLQQSVTFDGFYSSDSDGSIASYAWDFDGNGSVDSTQVVATHAYTQSGTFETTLTVTDDDGGSATSTIPIHVYAGGPPNQAPNGSISASVTSGMAPLNVNFDASGSSDADGTIQSYQWDLDGDGTYESSGTQVSKSYTTYGVYAVSLKVTDDDGDYSVVTTQITVSSGSAPSNGTLTATDAAHVDAGKAAVAQSNTGLRSIKMGGSGYTRYILLKFDTSLLIGADADTAVLNISVKHDGHSSLPPEPSSIRAYAVPDGMSGQNWTGGTSGITWNDVKSSGLISDLGTGTTPGGQLVSLGSSPTLQVGHNGPTTITSLQLADELDADSDGLLTILLAQEKGQDMAIRDPLTATLDFTVNNGTNASGYSAWISGYSVSDAGKTADPDNDGIKNLMEYALGLDPSQKDSAGLPMFTRAGDSITSQFSSTRAGIKYQVQVSTDLTSGWSNVGSQIVGQAGQTSNVPISMSAQMSGGKKLFMRLKVSE